MFKADIAIALYLVALAAGTGLLVLICRDQAKRCLCSRAIAILIIAVSFLGLLCTGYRVYKKCGASCHKDHGGHVEQSSPSEKALPAGHDEMVKKYMEGKAHQEHDSDSEEK